MPSPFPGMDPYIENSEIWPGFHADLATAIKHALNRQLDPKYYADVEITSVPHDTEVEISQKIRPDVSIFEPWDLAPEPAGVVTAVAIPEAPVVRLALPAIKLRSVRVYRTDTSELVTTIEILSPFNKRPNSDGLVQYRLKRAQILASRVHLVEIDLLWSGERPGFELLDKPLDTDYILLVNRSRYDRLSEIWPVALNEALPLIPIPLVPPDPPVVLDLNAAIREVYAGSRYERRIKYQLPVPPPALRPAMEPWVETLLATVSMSQRP